MNLRTVRATRYITPLREGGSLPAIIEADDNGMYVLKFQGAGQGRKALIAELVAGELARAVGLPVPEIVFVHLESELARTEPDPEIQDLIKASTGLNLALEYLPGSVMFDPLVDKPSSELASAVVWLDAYVTNVDRTPKNTNMLMWHRKLYLIDHGAALYFQHGRESYLEKSRDSFPMIKNHVLLPFANSLAEVEKKIANRLNSKLLEEVVNLIPDEWLVGHSTFGGAAQHRKAYLEYFVRRLELPQPFLEEATRARSQFL